jgi:hypothetical protein
MKTGGNKKPEADQGLRQCKYVIFKTLKGSFWWQGQA